MILLEFVTDLKIKKKKNGGRSTESNGGKSTYTYIKQKRWDTEKFL